MYLHIKFHQDPTIFDQVRILAGNVFYVCRHSRDFENCRDPHLKQEALQPKLNLLVKTPYYYHLWFWKRSRHKYSGKKIKMAATAAIFDFQTMYKQHIIGMHTKRSMCTKFEED